MPNTNNEGKKEQLTSNLLRTVTGNTSKDGVLLANDAISGTLTPVLGLSSSYLSLSSSVLVTARSLQIRGAGQVTDSFDDGTLDGVELAGRLPAKRVRTFDCNKWEPKKTYLGGEELSEDMVNKDWS